MATTLKQLAQEAIDVQDACNLSGVVHGWSRAITALRELLPELGTTGHRMHPINRMWASKVHDLCGMGLSNYDRYSEAYEACKQLANEG